jgi:predicted nucleotidyltransferase
MPSLNDIQALADQIARDFHPDKIILFGSYAYGTPTPDSDVDLLVVIPHDGEKAVDQAIQIRKVLEPDFPLDLIVRDPRTLRQRIEWGDFFLREATARGTVLYESAYAGVD